MDELAAAIGRVQAFAGQIASDGASAGGILHCGTCGTERPLGDQSAVGGYYANGWPTCCGYTMRWITQRQQDEGEN